MNYADKVSRKNDRMKVVAMGINALSIIALVVGLIYVVSIDVVRSPLVSIMAVDDSWVRFLGTESYYIIYSSMALLCLGTLLRWRAEDSEESLEKTNRYVSCN